MKKLLFACLLTGIMVSSFYACKKDTNQQMTSNEQNIEYTPEALAIWHKLVIFNEKMKNGSRDNEVIPADSVVWYLESMLNIQHAVDTSFCDSFKHDDTYSLNVDDDGNVAMSDVTALFDQMVIDIAYQLGHIESDYKYLLVADLYEESSRSGTLAIGLDGFYATSRFQTYTPFTEDDDWYYGNMLGRADGSYVGVSDGGQQLKLRLNNEGIKPTHQYNHWNNPQQSPNLDATNTQNRMWAQTATSPPIIEDDDMLQYLINMHYLIYNSPSDIPSGYFLTSYGPEIYFNMIYLWTNPEPNTTGYYWHKMTIIYGEPVYIPLIE